MSTEKHDAMIDSLDAADAAAVQPAEGASPEPSDSSLAADYERLLAEKTELQELLLRRQADFENFKRRSDRERGEIFETATMECLKNFLQVLDDLERGIKSTPADDGPTREFAKGLDPRNTTTAAPPRSVLRSSRHPLVSGWCQSDRLTGCRSSP